MKNVKEKSAFKIILLFAIILIVSLYWGRIKSGYFLDEIYSYGLSNSDHTPFVTGLYDDGIVDKTLTKSQLF